MHAVYQLKHKRSNRTYIGCTNDINRRLANHRSRTVNEPSRTEALYQAIRQFGFDAFTVSVKTFSRKRDAVREEARLIKELQPSLNKQGK